MTKLKTALFSSALLLAASGQVFAENQVTEEKADDMATASCVNPTSAPIVPDGNVASLDELIAAQNSIKAFQADLIEYRDCLNKGLVADAVEEADLQKNAAINAAFDASVDVETKVVGEFSTARTAFQSRQPAKK